jgi:hypothetical protein
MLLQWQDWQKLVRLMLNHHSFLRCAVQRETYLPHIPPYQAQMSHGEVLLPPSKRPRLVST